MMPVCVGGLIERTLSAPPSARDWAELIRALHVATVAPDYPRDLSGQCEGFFERIGRRVSESAVGRWVSAADLERGAERCQTLLATQTTRVRFRAISAKSPRRLHTVSTEIPRASVTLTRPDIQRAYRSGDRAR